MNTTTKVGLFTLSVLILLAFMVTWKSNLFLIRGGYEFIGSFANIEGLTVGSEVRYRGYNVGKVMKIDAGPESIKIYSIINKDILIPENSKLRVGFDGIVGLKYLEIRPGTSETAYQKGTEIQGISTAGIVDFVDYGAQNLLETKRILMTIRSFIEDPQIQNAFKNAVFTAGKATENIDDLVDELRTTNAGIMKITTDSNFQASVKGTIQETNKTLSSANRFFESFGKLNVKPSADVSYGNAANSIRANLDVMQNPADYLRIGIGEGPTRNLSLLDVQISRKVVHNLAMRIGMINTYLGGGIDLFPSNALTLAGDLYDFNNPKPSVPKIRTTAYYRLMNYSDMFIQADDIFNSQRNYSVGVRINGVGD